MTVLEALELMLRSGIRRVYYQEGKLPRDSGSEVSLSRICATRRHMCLSLSLSLTLSFHSSRSHRCSQRHLFSLLVLVTTVPLSLVAERQEISQERMEASRATKSNAEKIAGRIGGARQIERNGPGITLRAARAIKLFKTHCSRADVSKLCELPFASPRPFRRNTQTSDLPETPSPPTQSCQFNIIIAFKLFGKNFLKYNEFVFVYGRVNLYKLIWNINFIILGTDISWILYCIIIFENEFLYNFFF